MTFEAIWPDELMLEIEESCVKTGFGLLDGELRRMFPGDGWSVSVIKSRDRERRGQKRLVEKNDGDELRKVAAKVLLSFLASRG
jgi:hypothetical protein